MSKTTSEEPQYFAQWLRTYKDLVSPLEKRLSEENWLLATTGKKEHEKEVARLRTQLRKIYSDAKEFRYLSALRNNKAKMEPLEKRQLDLLWSSFASHQISHEIIERVSHLESEIEGVYNNFRGKVDGKDVDNNQIRKILREENDSNLRKKAWQASKMIGPEVIERVIEIVSLRNKGARVCGFKNYYLMSLELDELNAKRLFALLDDLEEKTREPFLQEKGALDRELAKRFGIPSQDLCPWHYADPFFQEAPPRENFALEPYFKSKDIVGLTRQTFSGMSLDIEGILGKSDLFGRPGKDQHAFCTMIGRSKDVRVLCNIEPNDYWMSTMLHEFGHGVYDWYLEESLPYFLYSPAHTLSTEAVAMFFGRLTRDPHWLKTFLDLDEKTMASFLEASRRQERLGMLVFVRWVLVMCHFELALYDDPEQDLNRLWWELVARYQDIYLRGEEKNRNAPDWVCKMHLALAPVYYQNYLLGELIASQVKSHLSRIVAHSKPLINNPDVGDFLIKEFFKSGSSLRWDRHLEAATGEKLNPDYFVAQFV